MKTHLLQLPADLVGLEVLHYSISVLVKVSDVPPETVDCHLPLVWVWRHSTGVGAWCGNTWILQSTFIHNENNIHLRAAENLPATSARARIRATAFMVVRWTDIQLWTKHREVDRLESVEQIPRVITFRLSPEGFAPPSCCLIRECRLL